ncbi:unnamed protein product [Scytosiphon promiscuus]
MDGGQRQRAWLLLSLWCGYLRVPRGATAFVVSGLLQNQQRQQHQPRGLANRSCGNHSCRRSINRIRAAGCLMMDSEGGEVAPHPPNHYSRNGKWTVYSSGGGRAPSKSKEPNRVLSKKAQARREKEYELGTKIQRMVKLKKLREVLTPTKGTEDDVSDEAWAEAAGETVETLRQALDDGARAKQEMVLSNLNLVDIIVKNYVGTFAYGRFTEKDLTQDATVGLIRAVEKFDPERGFLFSTYGRWWVRKFLHEGAQNHDRMVRIPNSAAYRIAKVKRVRGELEGELGRAPTKPEIALRADCTVQQVEACLEQDSFHIERLDKYMGHGFGMPDNVFAAHFGEAFLYGVDMLGPHPGETLEPTIEGAKVLQLSLRDDLSNAFVRLLDATERECLVLRYGLHDGVTNTIEQTAEIMDFCDPDDVRIITTQAVTKLRNGCLPEERKKLMSYLSIYEPKTPSYSKGNYDPKKSTRRTRTPTAARGVSPATAATVTTSTSGIGGGSSSKRMDLDSRKQSRVEDAAAAASAPTPINGEVAKNAGGRKEEGRRVVGDFSKIGKRGWMNPKARTGPSEIFGAGAGRRGRQEEERRLWASRFSKVEAQQHQPELRRPGERIGTNHGIRVKSGEVGKTSAERERKEAEEKEGRRWEPPRVSEPEPSADSGSGIYKEHEREKRRARGRQPSKGFNNDDNQKGEERRLWDFSKHGQEELQHELARYLRKHRLAKKNAEKAAALAAENAAAAAASGEKDAAPPGGGGGGGGGSTARRSKPTTMSSTTASPTTASARMWQKTSAAAAKTGRYRSSAADLARRQREHREHRRLELEEQGREEQEEWERKRALRPIPVGNGAGSAVVGDLEPVPNSREADQLEHLSRLLWDGEEEPADFALSYGKQPKRKSLQ